ncbi:hypothetical protein LCGC14_1755120 [marine sediment metagenome]|uniref:Uncharacterized protein n=1 Tax=marine sediment metagenome TaxID=412755 RepID=A0A0F9H2S5_9ZZZZ
MKRRERHLEHLLNAVISLTGMTACAVIGGELLSDILREEDNFPQVPDSIKPLAALVFVTFTALEANKVRYRLTKAFGLR